MKARERPFWDVKAAAKDFGEVYLYGAIVGSKWDDDEVTAADFKRALDGLGDINKLNIYINSPGGSVFAAQAIFSMLQRHPAKKYVFIDGLAASAASFVAMVGEVISMPVNSMMMIHKPYSVSIGNSDELRREAERLDKVEGVMMDTYMTKLEGKIDREKLAELLAAETWLTAKECLQYGFCDELIAESRVAACVDPEIMAHYRNIPEVIDSMRGGDGLDAQQRQELAVLIDQTNKDLEEVNKYLGGK